MGNILRNIINLFGGQKSTSSNQRIKSIDYSKFYRRDGHFTEEFYSNLKRTIVWTESIISNIKDTSNIDYVKILRSTNPVYEGKSFYSFDDQHYNSASTPEVGFNYESVLANALEIRNDTNLPRTPINKLGKILKFEIDITTHDGAPCAENGFVDESDIPPIDTWFYITTKYLYCWIPTMFVSKMQDASDVEIFGSYKWLEELNPELNDKIIARTQSGG